MSEKDIANVDLSNDSFISDKNMNKSNANEDLKRNKRKRKKSSSQSSSSESDDSSSSSDTTSSSVKRSRRHRRKKRRHDTHNHKNAKLDKLIADISDLKSSDAMIIILKVIITPMIVLMTMLFSLPIATKLKDPDVLRTPSSYLEVLKGIQRLDDGEWQNVRYAEVQKNYRHTPGFTELDYALIKQKDHLEKELRDFLSWAKATPDLNYDGIHEKIENIFVTGEFSKISNDALQLVCGHRAEIIQHRREASWPQ
ncbi:Uncharacterized protein OBRU01_10690 [Operophtera brumata]|uniref:Uncharacterized protein n=1 Tax=Operophtera brumata TaxID=104452 RepID=A0A0L7LDJ0_OPEBR|nr:Uncharacterized protein OBRU01_10690 [Operophtera brumata]